MIISTFSRNTKLAEDKFACCYLCGNILSSEKKASEHIVILWYSSAIILLQNVVFYTDQKGNIMPAHLGYQLILLLSKPQQPQNIRVSDS